MCIRDRYDGTSWSSSTDLGTGRFQLASGNASASTAALAFGGRNPGVSTATEEFTGEVTASVILTTS